MPRARAAPEAVPVEATLVLRSIPSRARDRLIADRGQCADRRCGRQSSDRASATLVLATGAARRSEAAADAGGDRVSGDDPLVALRRPLTFDRRETEGVEDDDGPPISPDRPRNLLSSCRRI